MTFCLGPDSSCHHLPDYGSCPRCIASVEEYELKSGEQFDLNGPYLTVCAACGELLQYWHLHSPVCLGPLQVEERA